MDNDFGEFSFSEDDLNEDVQLSLVDEAKDRIVDIIIKTSKDLKANIKYNEKTDAESNLRMLTAYLDKLIGMFELGEAENNGLAPEEIINKISEIETSLTEINLSNLEVMTKEDEESQIECEDIGEPGDDLGF